MVAGVGVFIADQIKANCRGKNVALVDQMEVKLVTSIEQVTHTE